MWILSIDIFSTFSTVLELFSPKKRISYRSILFYIVITIVYRLMGKREIGELSIIDFIVSIFIAEMVAISIENYKSSIFLSLIPIIILVSLQILCSHISLNHKK